MTHLASFADEGYIPGTDALQPGFQPLSNCFIAKSEQECLDNAPWSGMIGKGCGDPTKSDCKGAKGQYYTKSDYGDLDYGKEVGCYENCRWEKHSFRSVPYNIMLGGPGRNPGNVVPSLTLGEYGERFVKDFLTNLYYLDGRVEAKQTIMQMDSQEKESIILKKPELLHE